MHERSIVASASSSLNGRGLLHRRRVDCLLVRLYRTNARLFFVFIEPTRPSASSNGRRLRLR